MCVSAERYLVENIVDCFPVNSWPRALQRVPKHSLSNPHSHFARHITAFLHLAALDSPLAWSFRATFNSEITNEKHQNVKPSHRVDQETGTPVHSLRVETRRQSTPCATSAGDTHGEDPNVSLLCPHPQMHTTALQVWLLRGGGGHRWILGSGQIQNAKGTRMDCTSLPSQEGRGRLLKGTRPPRPPCRVMSPDSVNSSVWAELSQRPVGSRAVLTPVSEVVLLPFPQNRRGSTEAMLWIHVLIKDSANYLRRARSWNFSPFSLQDI